MTWDDMPEIEEENKKLDKLLEEDNIKLEKKVVEDNVTYENATELPKLPKIAEQSPNVMPINATDERKYLLMDNEDEKMVVQIELLDEAKKALVYQPTQGEPTLTIVGVMEAARRYKNIEMGTLKVEKTQDSWIAYAYAINLRDNLKITMAVEQPFRAPIGPQGSLVKDPFALQKAQAKAIRNCVKKVIPVNYFQAMIRVWMQKKEVVKNGTKK